MKEWKDPVVLVRAPLKLDKEIWEQAWRKAGENMERRLKSEKMARILSEVLEERHRQDEKWGEQNHPSGTGDLHWKALADGAKEACEIAVQAGKLTWRDILYEETMEAFAERDPQRLREELVQLCAVGVAWIEMLDREEGKK